MKTIDIKDALSKNEIIEGTLFDDKKVYIDAESIKIGGSWQQNINSNNLLPNAYDSDTIKFFYEKSLKIENPVILDIGANTGSFSLIPKFNQTSKIYAFEPMPKVFNILNKNIEINDLKEKVKTFQIALSDKNETAILKYPITGKDSGLASIGQPLRFNKWEEIEIQTMTLDEFAKKENIERVDMIKIDTEGCELFVLKGGENLIKKHHPDILLEYYEPNTKQFNYKPVEIIKLLTSWGYERYDKISIEDIYFYNPQKDTSLDLDTVNTFDSNKITLFTIPKAFKGHTGIIQKNAIKSWTKLKSNPNIVLIGNDEGTAELAKELNLYHIPDVKCNKFGTPLISSIFKLGENAFDTEMYCYINADIMLLSDFDKAIEDLIKNKKEKKIEKFLLTAQRVNINLRTEIDFENPKWEEKIKEKIDKDGAFDFKSAIDIFLYTKGIYNEIPDFAVGRCYWDHWLMWKASNEGAFIIDGSPSFIIIHQMHHYSHANKGYNDIWHGEEAIENKRLSENKFSIISFGSNHILNEKGEILSSIGSPDTKSSRKEMADKYFKMATEELLNKNFNFAFDYFQYGLDVYVSIYTVNLSQNVYFLKALALIGLKDFYEAKKSLITEIKFFPNNFYAKELLGYMISYPEKFKNYQFYEIDIINSIDLDEITIDKNKLELLDEIQNINNPQIIDLALKTLLEEYPNNLNLLKLYAKNKYNLGDKLQARFIYSKIIKFFLDDTEFLKAYSNILFETGNYIESLEYFNILSKKDIFKLRTSKYIKNKLKYRENKSKYLISVIINLYKYRKTINKNYSDVLLNLLDYIKNQTMFESLEILIIDSDLEQDENQEFEKYLIKYPNTKYIQFKNENNIFEILNKGIKLSSGKYIMEMEINHKFYVDNKLIEKMFECLKKDEHSSIAYSHFYILPSNISNKPLQSFNFDRSILLFDSENCLMSPTLMWERKIHDEYGYYNSSLKNPEYEFWLRILQTNKPIESPTNQEYTYYTKVLTIKERNDIFPDSIKFKKIENIDSDVLKNYQDMFNKTVINRKNKIQKPEIKKQEFDTNFFIENQLINKKEDNSYYILAQDWEYYSLPKNWINKINIMVDQIWVSSNFIKESFISSGVYPEKIKVIPTYLNSNVESIKKIEIETKKSFKFLYVGNLSKENGLDLLLDSYTQEFSKNDDVCLVIKNSLDSLKNDYKEIKEKIYTLLKNNNMPEIIFYENDDVSEENISNLFNNSNCFVYPFRIDASIKNIFQPAMFNIPIITTNGGSILDFCNEENSYLINAELQETSINEFEVFKLVDNTYNFEPDLKHLKILMRNVFENKENSKNKAIKLKNYLKNNYSFEKVYSIAKNFINELKEKPILRFNINKVIDNLRNDGLNCIKKEKYKEAEKIFFTLSHYSNTAENFYNLGISQFKQKKFDVSIDSFLNYLNLENYTYEVCQFLKIAFENIGDNESVEFFEKKLLEFPKEI